MPSRRFTVLSLVLWLAAAPAAALGDLLPADDRDLEALARGAQRLLDQAGHCAEGPCRPDDCALIGRAAAALDQAETLIVISEGWIADARRDALRHYLQLMNEIVAKGDRQAYLEKWLAWQQFFQTFGKLMLDLASIADGFEDISVFLSQEMGPHTLWTTIAHKAEELDGNFELMNNAFGVMDTLVQQMDERGVPLPDSFKSLLDVKNVASEAKAIVLRVKDGVALARAGELAGDEALKAAGRQQALRSLRNVGQIVGKIGLAIADSQRKGMEEEIGELASLILGEEETAHRAFLEWQRWAARSEAALAARAALKGQVERFAPCAAACPIADAGPRRRNDFPGYGEALRVLNRDLAAAGRELAELAAAFEQEIALPPALAVERSGYRPRERVTVAFQAPQCLADGGELRLLESDGGYLDRILLGGSTRGYADFTAPGKPGDYSVVLSSDRRAAPHAETGFYVIDPDRPLEPALLAEPLEPFPPPMEWSPPPPEEDRSLWPGDCQEIDCDCDNVEFGLLTPEFREECRATERALIEQCFALGRIEGTCHATASGPQATPF